MAYPLIDDYDIHITPRPPCVKCPVFAICISKNKIQCKQLYEYVCHTFGGQGYGGLKRTHIYMVNKAYRKYVFKTVFARQEISLTTNIARVKAHGYDVGDIIRC